MTKNQKILENFKDYNKFLSSVSDENKKVLTSLKMMYSIHMENNYISKNIIFLSKQIIRFCIKFILLPFSVMILKGRKKNSEYIVIKDTDIERLIAERLNISLVSIDRKTAINRDIFLIYKNLFKAIFLLLKDTTLNKKYIFCLLHRLIDYLLVYHTIKVDNIKTLIVENDRTPINLALVYRCIEEDVKTVKYDNWLIDPVNHNDVYCLYYFYPSMYHRSIIEKYNTNKQLIYVEGGFASWDILNRYKVKCLKSRYIVYFTQFGIEISQHIEYITDIVEVLKDREEAYVLNVKIHPREDIKRYKEVEKISPYIKLIEECDDIYALISEAHYCFSIFSTVSIEAKHIIENSYFINYYTDDFSLVDYAKIGLDLIKNKESLYDIFNGDFSPIEKIKFIKNNNCKYPNTMNALQRLLDDR